MNFAGLALAAPDLRPAPGTPSIPTATGPASPARFKRKHEAKEGSNSSAAGIRWLPAGRRLPNLLEWSWLAALSDVSGQWLQNPHTPFWGLTVPRCGGHLTEAPHPAWSLRPNGRVENVRSCRKTAGRQKGLHLRPHQSQLICARALVLDWLFQGRLELCLEWTRRRQGVASFPRAWSGREVSGHQTASISCLFWIFDSCSLSNDLRADAVFATPDGSVGSGFSRCQAHYPWKAKPKRGSASKWTRKQACLNGF